MYFATCWGATLLPASSPFSSSLSSVGSQMFQLTPKKCVICYCVICDNIATDRSIVNNTSFLIAVCMQTELILFAWIYPKQVRDPKSKKGPYRYPVPKIGPLLDTVSFISKGLSAKMIDHRANDLEALSSISSSTLRSNCVCTTVQDWQKGAC